MKDRIRQLLIINCSLLIGLTSCESGNPEYDDFDYQTVYFANQTPLRTVELGTDPEVDLTMDNLHKIEIKATMGGSYGNKRDILVDVAVDESLCNGLKFADGHDVLPLPSSHYRMASTLLTIPQGSLLGGVEVELTDAFFNDPKSISTNYVIPVRMTELRQGADSILEDKDYVLYGVKFVNRWHAAYLRRGVDRMTADGTTSTNVRHAEYIERDEQVNLTTSAYRACTFTPSLRDAQGKEVNVTLNLSFSDDGSCQVSTSTEGATATGSGKFVEKGEKKAIGTEDRDVLYLDYQIQLADRNLGYATQDTLVVLARGIKPEYFEVQ